MEPIIAIVGFLGAGKTTLLTRLTTHFVNTGQQPFIVLNDYENAYLDAQQLTRNIEPQWVKALNGSCICCSGINELRESVNRIPERHHGITLIEANGTSDACALMGFLGVGLNARFLPPVQVSVVDVKNWQRRGEHNQLEANQVQLSSLIVLTHLQDTTTARRETVSAELRKLNPDAHIVTMDSLNPESIPALLPSGNCAQKLDHRKAHWASSSIDLPSLPNQQSIYALCAALPNSLLRVKGCTKVGDDSGFTYFERTPAGEVHLRPFHGEPTTGAKLLTVGIGSNVETLMHAVETSIASAEARIEGDSYLENYR